jgi:conjugal transfer pilin signal peptidase TrbI
MQKIIRRPFLMLFILLNAYCLINLVTNGAYCQHFRLNGSNSLPFYLFKTDSVGIPVRNMYVSLSHPLSSQDLFKQVVGLPGDQIVILDQHVFINGINYGYIYENSPSGILLSPIKHELVPEEFFFVHATHPQSFDSRYAEFGLVAKDQLKERLCPIF